MLFYPVNLTEKVEFEQIKNWVAAKCGALGREKCQQQAFSTDIDKIQYELDYITDIVKLIQAETAIPYQGFHNISSPLHKCSIENMLVEEEDFIHIYELYKAFEVLYKISTSKGMEEICPHFVQSFKILTPEETIPKAIKKVIDIDVKKVREDASPELSRIRKLIGEKEKESYHVFQKIIRELNTKDVLAETKETIRNGRRVLAIRSEHKRQIQGILHDESSNGKITYIEPQSTVFINNEIIELQIQERREIEKILKELAKVVHLFDETLKEYQATLAFFDFSRAKALAAQYFNCSKPFLNPNQIILDHVINPVLFYHHQKSKKPTIPLSFRFSEQNRILIISGPNAGGKSIALKTVILCQLMLQWGMHVPAIEGAQMMVFDKIFIDIGDQQSVENDLSTYSSHLKNMHFMLEHGNAKTLLGIDEMGAGTDPAFGGAVAEAIVEELNNKGCYGIITTHYSNLKVFATNTSGVFNGSMQYDQQHLKPLYQLNLGTAGSSFTFEVAQKSGLPYKVIALAKSKVSEQKKELDITLSQIQNEKQYIKGIRKNVQAKEQQLEDVKKHYENLRKEIDREKKKIIKEFRDKNLDTYNELSKDLERMMREWRESQNKKEKFQEIREKIDSNRQALVEEIIREDEALPQITTIDEAIQIGDEVIMEGSTEIGKVVEMRKNIAIVNFGPLNTQVKLNLLKKVAAPKTTKKNKNILHNTESIEEKAKFEYELDIRGLYKDTALQAIENYMDKAYMYGFVKVRIVHGRGSGVLKQAVYNYLKNYPYIKAFHAEDERFGGDGVTVVEFSGE